MVRDEWIPLAGTRRIGRLSRSFAGWFDVFLAPFQQVAFTFSEGGEASVNLASGRLRFGRFDIPFTDIVRARTDTDAAFPGNVDLQLTTARGAGFAVQLHNGVEPIIPEATRAALLRVIPLTFIELPTDPFDPTRKHSRRIFPDHLTREQALHLLQRPL